MVARRLFLCLIGLLLVVSSGCCAVRRIFCDDCCAPCEMGAYSIFTGPSCGEPYCGDWHSHPPKCDPCDDCGHYVGCCEYGGPRGPVGRRGRAMMTVGADCDCGH